MTRSEFKKLHNKHKTRKLKYIKGKIIGIKCERCKVGWVDEHYVADNKTEVKK